MKNLILRFGILAGLIVSVLMSMSMIYMSKHPEMEAGTNALIVGYLGMLAGFSLIFVAVKNYRDHQQDGFIRFGQAFLIGLFITLIASTMYVITWAIVYHTFMPDFMEKYAAKMIESAQASSTPAELDKLKTELKTQTENYQKPVYFALMTYAEILPVGLIVSLVAALLLKRTKKTTTGV